MEQAEILRLIYRALDAYLEDHSTACGNPLLELKEDKHNPDLIITVEGKDFVLSSASIVPGDKGWY